MFERLRWLLCSVEQLWVVHGIACLWWCMLLARVRGCVDAERNMFCKNVRINEYLVFGCRQQMIVDIF